MLALSEAFLNNRPTYLECSAEQHHRLGPFLMEGEICRSGRSAYLPARGFSQGGGFLPIPAVQVTTVLLTVFGLHFTPIQKRSSGGQQGRNAPSLCARALRVHFLIEDSLRVSDPNQGTQGKAKPCRGYVTTLSEPLGLLALSSRLFQWISVL